MGGGVSAGDVRAPTDPIAATSKTIATVSACSPVAVDTLSDLPRQSSPRMPRRLTPGRSARPGRCGGDDLRPDPAGHPAEARIDTDALALADVREPVPREPVEAGVPVGEDLGERLARKAVMRTGALFT